VTESTELEVWAERANPTANMLSMARKIDRLSTLDSSVMDNAIVKIMSGILGATDLNEVFAAANAGTTAGKDFLNVPFLLQGSELGENGSDIQWKKSAAVYAEGNGFPWYTLAKVTDLQTGEQRTINCGGFTYVSVIYRLQELNAFDEFVEQGGMPIILSGKQTGAGFTVVIPALYVMPKMPETRGKSKA